MPLTEPYRMAWRYALLCPLLFLIPAAFEFVQHISEMWLGFYGSLERMKAAEHAPLRMVLGHFKVIALTLVTYWAIRFYAFDSDPLAARTLDPRAVRLFIPVLLWAVLWLILLHDSLPLLLAAGLSQRGAAILLGVLLLTSFALDIGLAAWKSAAVLGNGGIGFLRSIQLTWRHFGWALGLMLAALLPLMIVHYALAVLPIGRPFWAAAMLLAVDSLLVAYMIPVAMAANWLIARRVTSAAGLSVMPPAAQ
ncbi:hypothetical protein [Sphingobium lignivorans]|uniref:Uncharacterized protein n=1 Tax=Sphingobium lignivorans TaxID=2735886 RepID=A0ABR6NF89_9SPHN|nr:hypothetical protein [Sphingobium lignivorans]MBB5985163.1 hypothetical protein [Sphingobium lignivorans]